MLFLRRTLTLLLLVAAIAARAQSVHWEAGESSLGNVVQLVFEDCEPEGDPELPALPNATLSFAGTSTSMNIVNMSVSRTMTLSYIVQAKRAGALQIPAFTVKTNKGPIKVAAFTGSAPSAEAVAKSRLIPDRSSVWAGEVFGLKYEITAARRYNPQFGPTFSVEWNSSPAVTEEWAKPGVAETTADGQRSIVVSTATRAYIKDPNTVRLQPAQQVVHVQTGSASFGLFSQPRMEPVSVTSDQPTIEVRPLPAPPSGFAGAVGRFKLTSKVVPRESAVGEPITWSLELGGTGNWPDISGLPAREVSKDFQVVQPKAKKTNAEGKLFDATLAEDVVLVPTKPGRYTLGPVSFTFFNPQSGKYETAQTERVVVTVTPAAAPAGTAAPASPLAAPSEDETPAEAKQITAPAEPDQIPGSPLTGRANAVAPLSRTAMLLWAAVPFLGVIGFWVALAWRRAAATDPLRPQREARQRIATLLAGAPGSTPSPDTLLKWQHDSAILWQLPHAAPPATALPDAAWAALWREADRALYSPDATLPSDWIARAQSALAAKQVPGFNPARLFQPRNLLPFAAAVMLACSLCLPQTRAADNAPSPGVSYRVGDFEKAEKAWREAVAANTRNWVARHNLALALLQQDRAAEAAAHAAVAFVQHPNDRSVRKHFALTAAQAGFAPAPLQPFLRSTTVAAIASTLSAPSWQRVTLCAAFVAALALAGLLANAYGKRSRRDGRIAAAAAVIAFATCGLAYAGTLAYGEAAHPRAAITWEAATLRSIPTEADTSQKTTALPPGSIGRIQRTFLDRWCLLQFANGEVGWVRKDQVVPLWK